MQTEIEKLLEKTTALRRDREAAAAYIGSQPEKYRNLLRCAQHRDPNTRIKACWILEIIVLKDPSLLDTDREAFFEIFEHINQGSSIRPVSKIIAFWCKAVITLQNNTYPNLHSADIQKLTERCFSWLLSDLPVAVKAFSMEALLHLGKSESWVHPELKAYIEKEFANGSPGFKSRAKKVLSAIEKHS